MVNLFGQLDDIDREAIREGSAISRLQNHRNKIGVDEARKNRKRTGKRKKEKEIDILRILNIIQGK